MDRLKVTVERIDGYCNQFVLVGDAFTVEDNGMIRIPEGKRVCLWALQSMIPSLLVFQQRGSKKGDWMEKPHQRLVCPDPKGLVHYRVERTGEA